MSKYPSEKEREEIRKQIRRNLLQGERVEYTLDGVFERRR